jgi:2-succinyl-6-hydroxy-2,4-cyclohexadiene-1-carboxylate synthase
MMTAPAALLLPGFGASAAHWDRVVAAMDGAQAVPLSLSDAEPVTPDGVAAMVASRGAERFALVGYSMGGRAALHVALAMPERVRRLVLVSASAGIDDAGERAARRVADDALALEIERNGIEWFVDRWAKVPLFAGDPDWVRDEVAEDERRATPAALAACLRGLGPGAMTPMWDRLGELAMPVAILAGERDGGYVDHARRLAAAIEHAALEIVPGAGHRLALEAPDAVAQAIAGP